VNKSQLIQARARLLSQVRAFFSSRGLTEVDVPLLVSGAPLDDHIDLFETEVSPGVVRYLHSSPEYGMKRLLAAGCGDLFQISHVFRKGELSARHNPEFLMAEWYRIGWTLDELIEETVALLHELLGPLPVRSCRYGDLLQQVCGKDLWEASASQCREVLHHFGIELSAEAAQSDAKSLIQLLFASVVEPHLTGAELIVVRDFPPDQAALARVVEKQGRRVAERFEIYGHGLELCNGYDELNNPQEQRQRFEASNLLRLQRGLAPYLMDGALLEDLERMPPCAGVAVGLDRVFQLALQLPSLADVLPWSWRTC